MRRRRVISARALRCIRETRLIFFIYFFLCSYPLPNIFKNTCQKNAVKSRVVTDRITLARRVTSDGNENSIKIRAGDETRYAPRSIVNNLFKRIKRYNKRCCVVFLTRSFRHFSFPSGRYIFFLRNHSAAVAHAQQKKKRKKNHSVRNCDSHFSLFA